MSDIIDSVLGLIIVVLIGSAIWTTAWIPIAVGSWLIMEGRHLYRKHKDKKA